MWNTATNNQWQVVVDTWYSRGFKGVFDFANQVTDNWNKQGTGQADWNAKDWNAVFDGFNNMQNG